MSIEIESESTAVAAAVAANPGIVLIDKAKRDEFYAYIKREVEEFVPDLTTEKGRKTIASLAFKVSRTKTAIDDAGAALKSEWLKKSQAVDESRREIRAQFDMLRDQARKPLDDWEAAEERRKARCNEICETLQAASVIPSDATPESIAATLAAVALVDVSIESLAEFCFAGEARKKAAIVALQSAAARLSKEEADRQELARLRAENDARMAADAEAARLKAEEEARERARIAEQKRAEEEAARLETVRVESEARARRQAEQAAREAEEKIRLAHLNELARLKAEQDKKDGAARKERERIERQIADEKRSTEEAQKKHAAELQRIADGQAARKREADAKAEADRKLAANKKHRAAVMTEAKCALMAHTEIDEAVAVMVVRAIVDGNIPAVSMRFTS
jgi:hypothetical protein